MQAEEIEEGFGLAGLGAEMEIGDEQCAVALSLRLSLQLVSAPRFVHDAEHLE
jgi:hypothetical protein